ncbi:hypothetical protein [Pseudomonas chlororaphis]|uniref:hypothetical protein n=1 Tax=Pseudomonas chlororaphis TaxID=587753 RepID=UPI001B317768|nr:hypothetical protein [Pseudomonas chlororaphis]MBP5054357.1 hypothetical protein [Pseudomonas chlororaphis]MBP5137486.1 hypothetical protein [Pseudomonas chlororaphis]QTT99534.1 hypothetical protein HUT26_09695 [Pseudomonas chlororaphis]
MTTTAQQRPVGDNDFAQLGSRLVRFGQALQEPSTRVGELVALAQACGINFKLRVVSESGGDRDE